MLHAASAFQVMAARMLHQNAPHQLGRNREEMGAILPLHALIIHQAHVGFIDQGRGLQAVAGALAFHVAARQAVEFVINDGGQPFERALVSVAPGAEQRADVAPCRFAGVRPLHPSWLNYTAARPVKLMQPCMIVPRRILRLSRMEGHNMKTILTSIAAGSLLAALAMAQTPRYTVTDLGTLRAGRSARRPIVSNNGLVAGATTVPDGTQHAVLWYRDSKSTSPRPDSGANSGAFGVNEAGQVEIQAETSAKDPNNENFCGLRHGLKCLAFPVAKRRDDSAPDAGRQQRHGRPDQQSRRNGRDCGEQHSGPGVPARTGVQRHRAQVLDFEAVIWGPGPGQIRELRPLPGDTVGMALWINDNGQAVGASGTCANTVLPPLAYRAARRALGKRRLGHDLGNLGGTARISRNIALAINNQGQVVGASSLTADSTPALITLSCGPSETGMQDLGTLPGDCERRPRHQ